MTVKEILDTAKEKMNKTCGVYQRDMVALRAGRANPQLLDRITVDYYGTPTPLNQIATSPLLKPACCSLLPGRAR